MKTFLKYTFVLAALAAGTSCSDDYLETVPAGSAIEEEQQIADVSGYGSVINGISQLMIAQQLNYGQGYCGMSAVMMRLGDMCGNDLILEQLGGYNSANMKLCVNDNAAYSGYAWWFLYNVIGNANRVLSGIDEAQGDAGLRDLYKAQALTYRAYAYTYLVQIFGKRWKDSQNGASDGVVLRIDASTGPQGLATLAKCYEQIYTDCDNAIELFESSGKAPSDFYLPGIGMAYGVKARAALAREDWETAAQAAHAARDGYELMTQNEYAGGFCVANSEWIYGGFASEQENMWFYSFGAYHAYNGQNSGTADLNTIGNRELVDQFPDTDVRKKLFFHQNLFPSDRFVYGKTVGSYAQAFIKKDEGEALKKKMLEYIKKLPSYRAYSAATYLPKSPAIYGQLKFAVFALPGVSQQCFMRAGEMYLIEAEALCKQAAPDEAAAKALLDELNGARDDAYTPTSASGQELIDQILLTRRMELWGEGAAWFDLKRLGASISRKAYAEADANGECAGTFGKNWAVTVGPNDPGTNDWVWVIPLAETQYNDLIE